MQGMLQKPDMHQATREKRKTVTRRLCVLANRLDKSYDHKWVVFDKKSNWWLYKGRSRITDALETFVLTPRYHVDEVVYIKEAWRIENYDVHPILRTIGELKLGYKLGGNLVVPCSLDATSQFLKRIYWQTPLFMPAWAARTFIKITDVRPERLQEITVGEAKREGIIEKHEEVFKAYIHYPIIDRFKKLWDSINPKYPFSSNPFVWVYTYVMVDKPVDITI